jgi:hypothetical protein
MSELIQKNDNRATIRWKLLTTASALALTAYVSAAGMAKAEDVNRPQIWLELGGQFAQAPSYQEAFLPPFLLTPAPPFETVSPQKVERVAPGGLDGDASLSFEPTGTDWIVSAQIVFGRSNRNRFIDQVTQHPSNASGIGGFWAYQTIKSKNSEEHTVLDFRAGRDFGLGMGVRSSVDLGVRYVHFGATTDVRIHSQPTNANGYGQFYNRNYGQFQANRNFNGIGPSLSWDASAAVAGNPDSSEIAVDWGINGAVLFGHQSVRGHHQSTTARYRRYYPTGPLSYYSKVEARTKQVSVPNLGGYAAVSWRYANAKVSLGYRADMFFGAIDDGIDAAKKENRGFYGPFASISIGIGD